MQKYVWEKNTEKEGKGKKKVKGQGEKGRKRVKKGEKGGGGRKREKMEEISLNGGEGFQEASWGVGNVFKKFEEYTPLKRTLLGANVKCPRSRISKNHVSSCT